MCVPAAEAGSFACCKASERLHAACRIKHSVKGLKIIDSSHKLLLHIEIDNDQIVYAHTSASQFKQVTHQPATAALFQLQDT